MNAIKDFLRSKTGFDEVEMELVMVLHGCFIPQIAGTLARPLRGVFGRRSRAF